MLSMTAITQRDEFKRYRVCIILHSLAYYGAGTTRRMMIMKEECIVAQKSAFVKPLVHDLAPRRCNPTLLVSATEKNVYLDKM
jgi:hypothetical protein